MMQTVPGNDAQNEFQYVLNQVCSGLGPVLITGAHGNAVLVSEAEWRRIQDFVKRRLRPQSGERDLQRVSDPV